jgi:hypothetical protein
MGWRQHTFEKAIIQAKFSDFCFDRAQIPTLSVLVENPAASHLLNFQEHPAMTDAVPQLRERLILLLQRWRAQGVPSHQALAVEAEMLATWKKAHHIDGLWLYRPLMLTATLDDAIGQGLHTIHRYADVLGIQVIPLGLLQEPESILAAVRRWGPDFLGLTILQLDSDDDLCRVGHHLDSKTRLIAGGPVFRFDPEMADRCKVDYVAKDVSGFIDYMLRWPATP